MLNVDSTHVKVTWAEKKALLYFFTDFFKDLLQFWNEPLNKLPLAMKHLAWVSSGFPWQIWDGNSAGWERAGFFKFRRAGSDKIFQPAQDSSVYCCNLSGGIALNVWFTTNGMCAKNNNMYTWHERAIIEWLQRMNSIVACCHTVKLCAHTARALRSQQYQTWTTTSLFAWFTRNKRHDSPHAGRSQRTLSMTTLQSACALTNSDIEIHGNSLVHPGVINTKSD